MRRGKTRAAGAFTLIELLVVMAIVAILAALLLPALGAAKNQARLAEELSAGRQLMLGTQMYADDWSGAMFPGYFASSIAVDSDRQPLFFPENARYPWRLAPYLGGSIQLIYSGKNRSMLDNLRANSASDYDYSVSLFPSLGMNSYFIGGNQTEFPAATANAKFGAGTVVVKMAEAARPADLMVFISARSAVTGNAADGYYEVTPPFAMSRQWSPNYTASLTPQQWGYVAPRFSRHAAAAFLDGHAESMGLDQMQDMRHWCNRATAPSWTLSP